jgi:hypothetical protein
MQQSVDFRGDPLTGQTGDGFIVLLSLFMTCGGRGICHKHHPRG